MTDFSCSERQSRRVVIHRPGGYEQLRLERGPLPRPAAGEQLVATRAIGVNYADCVVRMGLYASARKYVGWPITPGFELVGRPHDDLTQAPVIAPWLSDGRPHQLDGLRRRHETRAGRAGTRAAMTRLHRWIRTRARHKMAALLAAAGVVLLAAGLLGR